MALQNMTLTALDTTKLKHRFSQAVEEVSNSLNLDKDVPGDREINIKIVFSPKNGYCITRFKCSSKVPAREEGAITMISSEGILQLETTSADARQPGFLDNSGNVSLGAAREKGAV